MTWQKLSFEEDGSWWSAVQKCGATIALAAVLATTGLSTAQAAQVFNYQQDDPAGNLKAVPEELYWQQGPVSVPASLYQNLPYEFDTPEAVAQVIPLRPDEDFWNNPVASVPANLLWAQQWTFDQQEPAGSLSAIPDELYWQLGPPFSTPAALAWPQQWTFDVQDPGNLYGQFDEDFWINPVAPTLSYWLAPLFTDDDVALPQPTPFDDSICIMPIIEWPSNIVTMW